MARIMEILKESDLRTLKTERKLVRKTTVGRELINNLMFRLNRRGNVMIEMKGTKVDRVRLDLASNFFDVNEKNFSVMVKVFVKDNRYLMFNYNGVVIRASDVFGQGINRVRLN